MSAAERLASLLAEDADAARLRAARAFDGRRGNRPVVLVGAGNLGRRASAAMTVAGDAPIAFADRDPSLAGRRVDGVPVMSLEAAVREHPGALFAVTIWGALSPHRISATHDELAALGVRHLATCSQLFWKYRAMLPHYLIDLPDRLLDARDDVTAAFALLSDDASRDLFVAQVRARLTGDLHALDEPVAHAQYFADDLIAWRDDECVVDGGAFTGDTLQAWMVYGGRRFAAWTAFEPHPESAAAFARTVTTLPADVASRVVLYETALGARRGATSFSAAAVAGASASRDGSIAVDVASLDEMAHLAPPTFVKLDIEGAELDALAGMRSTIRRARPVLAICAYHRQDHLWRVPLAIAAMVDEYDFILRAHGAEGWDLVCYAVPRERRVR